MYRKDKKLKEEQTFWFTGTESNPLPPQKGNTLYHKASQINK